MRKIVIGVMGPGANPSPEDCENARELGKLVAQQGWVLLTGGRDAGVMDAASQGAKSAGGLVVGILPTADTKGMSDAVDIAIATDMGSARNNINVLSSDVVIACGIGAGTASEIALALVAKKKAILLNNNPEGQVFFKKLSEENVFVVQTPEEAIALTSKLISTCR